MSVAPTTPKGLGADGRALWRRVIAGVAADPHWELDARDLHLLEQAVRAADRATELEQIIATDGLMVTGSTGQSRLHPAVSEARMTRQLVAILLSKVDLHAPEEQTRALNGRQRNELKRRRDQRRLVVAGGRDG